MSNTLQAFLTDVTQKAAGDLEAALLRLPEDKRAWSPTDSARSALDQVAECAILNGSTRKLIETRVWDTDFDYAAFVKVKEELVREQTAALSLLKANTAQVIETIGGVAETDLAIEIETPFGALTLAQILAYPYWNMAYHEGQINYIASMLGCLS